MSQRGEIRLHCSTHFRAERRRIDPEPFGAMIAVACNLGGRHGVDVHDLLPLDLDADRVQEDQTGQQMREGDCKLGGNPAAHGRSNDDDVGETCLGKDGGIGVGNIAHRFNAARSLRAVETRMGRQKGCEAVSRAFCERAARRWAAPP